MSYYTEGYVKSVGVSIGKKSSDADKLYIEIVAPYKVLLGGKDFALFVAGDGEDNDINSNEEMGAKIKSVATLESVKCEEFDAQFLFLLKQTHSKVRFVFNDELRVLERIVAI
jgi:hypothetical protein